MLAEGEMDLAGFRYHTGHRAVVSSSCRAPEVSVRINVPEYGSPCFSLLLLPRDRKTLRKCTHCLRKGATEWLVRTWVSGAAGCVALKWPMGVSTFTVLQSLEASNCWSMGKWVGLCHSTSGEDWAENSQQCAHCLPKKIPGSSFLLFVPKEISICEHLNGCCGVEFSTVGHRAQAGRRSLKSSLKPKVSVFKNQILKRERKKNKWYLSKSPWLRDKNNVDSVCSSTVASPHCSEERRNLSTAIASKILPPWSINDRMRYLTQTTNIDFMSVFSA